MSLPDVEIKSQLVPRRRLRKTLGIFFYGLFLAASLVGILGLIVLLFEVLTNGIPWVNWQFITDYPSRFPEEAGLFSALMGTVWVMGMTAVLTVPVGVGAAIYLEEYAPDNFLTRFIEINVANLAGVPSIVYGLLGMGLFAVCFYFIRSFLAGKMKGGCWKSYFRIIFFNNFYYL